MKTLKKVAVSWNIRVDCECPHCEHYFDLLSVDGDFWEQLSGIEAGEAKFDMDCEWECPKCGKEFIIDNIQH